MPVSPPINLYVAIIWILFGLYWASAFLYDVISGKYKKIEKRQSSHFELIDRFLLGGALVLVIASDLSKFYPLGINFVSSSMFIVYLGFAIGLIGILFAIWARIHLGGNWSGTIVLKKGQTLVTTGPYSIVRNPIYTGISFGIIGSAIVVGTVAGLIAMALVLLFSYYRVRTEDKLMEERFGQQYMEYRKKVKAFIPFVI